MESSCITLDDFHSAFEATEDAAKNGPVYITVEGQARYVLLNYEDYAAMIRLARLPDLRMDQLMISFTEDSEMAQAHAGPTPL